jgi:hypothetical protein
MPCTAPPDVAAAGRRWRETLTLHDDAADYVFVDPIEMAFATLKGLASCGAPAHLRRGRETRADPRHPD